VKYLIFARYLTPGKNALNGMRAINPREMR
jgi:hypothetical protein